MHRSAAEGFAAGAETYARGRPDYPPQALEWLRLTLGLRGGRVALDLGAGTGKFTRHLLATGASVIAVDPVPEMLDQLREAIPQSVSSSSPPSRPAIEGFRETQLDVRTGTAEHIPADSGSVDVVVCSQSFHWFATPAALNEIHRVLRPGGILGLIWNVRDESIDWVAKLSRLINPYEGTAPRMTSGEWRKLFPAPGFGPLHEARFPHAHIGLPDRVILDRTLSTSFIAALPDEQRAQVATQVRNLIASTPSLANQREVTFPYYTAAFHCVRTQ